MEINIEISFIVNFALNFFILKLASLFLRKQLKFGFISAFVASIIALLSPLITAVYLKIIIAFLTCLFILFLSFENKTFKEYLVCFLVIVLATFLFGGGCLAVESFTGQFPLFVVAIIGLTIYIIASSICRYQKRKNIIANFTHSVVFKDGGLELKEKAFLDSGNMLYDSVTKKPIILVTYDVFSQFYKDISFIKAWTKQTESFDIKNGHYININGVGKGSRMLVFMIDEVIVDKDKKFKNVMLGLSFAGFDKSFGAKVLLHSELV